jgi:phosphate-selective porin O/P
MIRRGRFIFSGDVTDHLYLYAQSDFNASTGATDFSVQMRDLYADVALDARKAWRVRLGQSKVPYGWVNMQSSQNRGPLERPDALNGAVEGERDLGAYLMWASPEARRRFRDLVGQGLKGSGDYGVVAAGLYSGQGLNRPDQNGDPHVMARVSYPFKLASGQFLELGAQGYYGRFVTQTQAIDPGTGSITPARPDDGVVDERLALTAVWYPQPFGFETEWNFGRGPELSDDLTQVESRPLQGGYVQFDYRHANAGSSIFPFVRWQYYDGGRKFARNAPPMKVNEMDIGLEFARWAELEFTMIYTRTFERTRTSLFPYDVSRGANRVGFQAQWNY